MGPFKEHWCKPILECFAEISECVQSWLSYVGRHFVTIQSHCVVLNFLGCSYALFMPVQEFTHFFWRLLLFFFVIRIYKLFPKEPLTVTAIYFSAFVFIFNFISWDLLFSYLVWLGVSQFCLFSLKKQSHFPGSFYSFIFQFHYCPSYLYFFCIVHLDLLILSLIP